MADLIWSCRRWGEAAFLKDREEPTTFPSSKSFMPRAYCMDGGSYFMKSYLMRVEQSLMIVGLGSSTASASWARVKDFLSELKAVMILRALSRDLLKKVSAPSFLFSRTHGYLSPPCRGPPRAGDYCNSPSLQRQSGRACPGREKSGGFFGVIA